MSVDKHVAASLTVAISTLVAAGKTVEEANELVSKIYSQLLNPLSTLEIWEKLAKSDEFKSSRG